VRDVDHIDLILVRKLLDNPRASYAELSREAGIAESTAKRRVAALIESGVITPAVIPNVRRLGFQTLTIVGLKVDLNHLQETAETIRDLPEVTSLHMTMGRYDLHATVASRDLDSMRTFLIEKIAPLPGIRDIESFVSTRALKILRDWRLPPEVILGNGDVDGADLKSGRKDELTGP
jgi:Lrp/AsnC family transcriptional regulator, regulator for asnA, asnC and gidA